MQNSKQDSSQKCKMYHVGAKLVIESEFIDMIIPFVLVTYGISHLLHELAKS